MKAATYISHPTIIAGTTRLYFRPHLRPGSTGVAIINQGIQDTPRDGFLMLDWEPWAYGDATYPKFYGDNTYEENVALFGEYKWLLEQTRENAEAKGVRLHIYAMPILLQQNWGRIWRGEGHAFYEEWLVNQLSILQAAEDCGFLPLLRDIDAVALAVGYLPATWQGDDDFNPLIEDTITNLDAVLQENNVPYAWLWHVTHDVHTFHETQQTLKLQRTAGRCAWWGDPSTALHADFIALVEGWDHDPGVGLLSGRGKLLSMGGKLLSSDDTKNCECCDPLGFCHTFCNSGVLPATATLEITGVVNEPPNQFGVFCDDCPEVFDFTYPLQLHHARKDLWTWRVLEGASELRGAKQSSNDLFCDAGGDIVKYGYALDCRNPSVTTFEGNHTGVLQLSWPDRHIAADPGDITITGFVFVNETTPSSVLNSNATFRKTIDAGPISVWDAATELWYLSDCTLDEILVFVSDDIRWCDWQNVVARARIP